MRNFLFAALLATTAILPSTGCLIGGCGAYDGAGDRVYARESEMLIVCSNGGFVANLQSQSIEGRIEYNSDGTAIGVKGDDASLAFDWIVGADGGASTPQLGDGAWAQQDLDQTALDHADVLCQDLTTRAWWAQQ